MNGLVSDAASAVVVSAATGDEDAFARIVAAYRLEMVRVAFVVCGDWELAQDATQSALWIAWRKLPTLREPTRLRPWLLAVAVNEARQIVRRRRRPALVELTSLGEPAADERSGEASAEVGELDLGEALSRLDPSDRALVGLRYLADLDSAEIGRLMRMSASGVRSKLARALDRLRKDLDDG